MSLILERVSKKHRDIDKIKNLFNNAFPPKGKIPLWYLLYRTKLNCTEFLAIYDDDIFVGFTYVTTDNDLTLILFLAIDSNIRGKGYGTKVLDAIKKRYISNRIILEIETIDKKAKNYEQRVKRKKFYIKNGYRDAEISINLLGDIYDMLILGEKVDIEEYYLLIKKFIGRILYWIVGSIVICKRTKKTL